VRIEHRPIGLVKYHIGKIAARPAFLDTSMPHDSMPATTGWRRPGNVRPRAAPLLRAGSWSAAA